MQNLFILYSTLAVFGIGVTVIDLFGIFDQSASSDDGDAFGDSDAAADSGAGSADTTEGTPEGFDSPDDSSLPAMQDDASYTESPYGDRGSWVAAGQSKFRQGTHNPAPPPSVHGAQAVPRIIGTLRTGVYFSLGAGPTGLFALLTGVGGVASLAWSAGAGVFIAVLSRTLRAFVRKDLDSSIKPEEFLMDQAVISVPVTPGAMGKAIVSRYGRDTELYVRCKDHSRALPKGETVRIVDMDDDCYWVEAHV
jgi:hypothetical protein